MFVYNAEAQLNDGSAVLLDLEKTGWADKSMLAQTHRFTLIPKAGFTTSKGQLYPFVVVNIPKGAKPIYRSRVFRRAASNNLNEPLIEFRCYCIGWKRGATTVWTWVLPTGDIETGTDDDSWLSSILFDALVKQL